ncbi:MAG: T9SS type A sorting domain-containing protein [Flavobacteriales bacterium]
MQRTTLLLISAVAISPLCLAQTTYDARILDYVGLKFPCDGGATPVLKIRNEGSATMSGCVVETWKNGIQVSTFNWQLALPALQGQTRQPIFPPMPDVDLGDDLEFRIISVNTIPDEDPSGNILQVDMDQVPAASPNTTVTVEVETGANPGALTWEIRNSLAEVIATGGPYPDANTVITGNTTLSADACFSFKALDASRGVGATARVRVKSGGNTLIALEGSALQDGLTKGLTIGNNEGCTQNLVVEIATDALPEETSWEIIDQATNAVVCASSGAYPPSSIVTETCCLPSGCYRLRAMDLGGDGIVGGGYVLRTAGSPGARIIDDAANFSSGSFSAITAQQGFCLPLSADKLIYTSCDKLDWTSGQYIVATTNVSVSAEFGGANAATSGYEFWFFDPNGTYSFRKFRSHTVSDGFSPANASRACHLKINNWALANQIPANVLMNVSVRSRVSGVNGAYGPVCRFMIDPVRAACPLTKLMDVPGNPYLSCGASRAWGNGHYVHARPVTGANKYQFRFRISGEPFEVVRTSSTYFVQLNWITNPLQDGVTYDVEVRASKNNGATWCTDPAPMSAPWGDVCLLTIDNTPANGGNENMLGAGQSEQSEGLRMYPNPNRGDQLYLSLDAMEDGVRTVSVDIFDLTGKRVSARTIAVNDGSLNSVMDLNGELAHGMYLVNITAGAQHYTERLVLQP